MIRLLLKRIIPVLLICLALSLAAAGCGGDDDDQDQPDDDTADDDDDADPYPPGADDGSFADDPEEFVSGLDQRIDQYLAACSEQGFESSSLHSQVCRLALDSGPLREDAIDSALKKMDERQDCADFRLASLVRMFALYQDRQALTTELYDRILTSMINFKYWIDEPGNDGMCYWSENHYILFHSAAFVLGDLFPDLVFANSGRTGSQLRAKARPYVVHWLNSRLRWGFSEFHSNVYYNEDIAPLLNLADFGNDEEIQQKARMVLDIVHYEMALNNHEGVFGVAHGRSYMKDKQRRDTEDTKSIMWLLFGKGDAAGDYDNMSSVALATSSTYRLPAVIESIGQARPRGLVTKERCSINIKDGEQLLGLPYDDFFAGMHYWTMGGYVAAETIQTTMRMAETWGLFEVEGFFSAFGFALDLIDYLPDLAQALDPIVRGVAIEQVNTYAYRTPEAMLASAQNWRPATLGAQSHDWQATLGADALVFTTFPGGLMDDSMAGTWTGGWRPQIGQHRTAAIILYRLPEFDIGLIEDVLGFIFPKYTHAYFPQAAFDEVIRADNWTFGRLGEGYLALYSSTLPTWQTEGEWAGKELIAEGERNVWICEVGDMTLYDSFEDFVDSVTEAPLYVSQEQVVSYHSPGQGQMDLAWGGQLLVRGQPAATGDYPRFDSPFAVKQFDAPDLYRIGRGDLELILDPQELSRTGAGL